MPIDQVASGAVYGGIAVSAYGEAKDAGHSDSVADHAAFVATSVHDPLFISGKPDDFCKQQALLAARRTYQADTSSL